VRGTLRFTWDYLGSRSCSTRSSTVVCWPTCLGRRALILRWKALIFLPRSAKVHDYYVVECDADVAGELLADAQRHCPDAVRPIQVGLRRNRPTY